MALVVRPSGVLATILLSALAAGAGQPELRVGDAFGAEHVAFVRAGVPGGLVGPARECAAGDPRDIRCCVAPDGAFWIADSRDCVVYRIKDDQARIVAGCGVKGYRDGPADRAMFVAKRQGRNRYRAFRETVEQEEPVAEMVS